MALEDIYTGIESHRLIRFMYTTQKGDTSLRTVEPYSVERGLFFAFDISKDGTRSFFLAMMSDVELLDVVFIPRF